MSRNITLYIKDILQNMREAVEFIQGMTYEEFISDKRTLNADYAWEWGFNING